MFFSEISSSVELFTRDVHVNVNININVSFNIVIIVTQIYRMGLNPIL